ncbi:MAG: hypothetical protein MK183_00445 [Verrucomicrobiales bacterium]|nr:hypothetical protein [Verrucomicrobiales bacterium]
MEKQQHGKSCLTHINNGNDTLIGKPLPTKKITGNNNGNEPSLKPVALADNGHQHGKSGAGSNKSSLAIFPVANGKTRPQGNKQTNNHGYDELDVHVLSAIISVNLGALISLQDLGETLTR